MSLVATAQFEISQIRFYENYINIIFHCLKEYPLLIQSIKLLAPFHFESICWTTKGISIFKKTSLVHVKMESSISHYRIGESISMVNNISHCKHPHIFGQIRLKSDGLCCCSWRTTCTFSFRIHLRSIGWWKWLRCISASDSLIYDRIIFGHIAV